jgi:hypothetical protein
MISDVYPLKNVPDAIAAPGTFRFEKGQSYLIIRSYFLQFSKFWLGEL